MQRKFVVARILSLAVPVSTLVSLECSTTRLEGDAVIDLVRDTGTEQQEGSRPVCGNGIVENGEECDGGERACNTEHCGGGFQSCGPDCTWGPCDERVFRLVRGPMQISSHVFWTRESPEPLWDGRVFSLFYCGRDAAGATMSVFFSTVDPLSGAVTGPLTTFSMDRDYWDYIRAAASLSPTELPFSLLVGFSAGEDSFLHLEFADLDGRINPDLRMALVEGYYGGLDTFIGAGDQSLAVAWSSFPSGNERFMVLDQEYEILAERSLDYSGILDASFTTRTKILVPVPEGWAVISKHFIWESATAVSRFSLQTIGLDGSQVLSPRLILEGEGTNMLSDAAWTGEAFGVLYADKVPDSIAYNLFLALVHPEGGLLRPPQRIGEIFLLNPQDASIAWTGSEFAAVFAEPSVVEEDAPRILRAARLDGEGNLKGEVKTFHEGEDVSEPCIAWSGEVFGIAWIGPYLPDHHADDLHVSFAVAGCAEP